MAKDLVRDVSNGKIAILRVGEESGQPNGTFYAPATISLIKSLPEGSPLKYGVYTLVDCGGFGESKVIENLLANEKIFPWWISQVLITHNHPDHMGNIHMFNQANVITPDSIFDNQHSNSFVLMPPEFYQKPGEEYKKHLLENQIKLISTPGHSGWDYSVVHEGLKGTVAMVGDLFWSKDDFEHDSQFMELCVNPEMQKRSRGYVREILKPDVIVPGHDEPFAPKY